MMDDGFFSFPIDMAGRSSDAMDGIVSETTSNSLVQNHFNSFDLNNQSQQTLAVAVAEYPMFSTLQGAPIHHLQSTQDNVMGSNSVLGRGGPVRDASPSCSNLNADLRFQGQYVGGAPVSSTSLATLLASRSDHQENLSGLALPEQSIYQSEAFRTFASSNYTDDFNNAVVSSVNYCSGEMYGNVNDRGGFNRFPAPLGPAVKSSTRVGLQPYSSAANLEPNSWVSSNGIDVGLNNPFESQNISNALSLSLATCHPSTVNGSSISDQCSEISCSAEAYRCLKGPRLGLDQTACKSKDLSLSFGSYGVDQFSRVVSGSKYLQVMQEILAQIASYSLGNLDSMVLSTGGNKTRAVAPHASSYRMLQLGIDESPNVDGRFEVQVDPALQKRALEAKKSQLLSLLQVVDERYNQCLDEIHTVISAFHAATELNPQVHTRFALQTISFTYKSLRDRISNQILAMGAFLESECTREAEGASETSYFEKKWALQQLKKKDHQLWRPQRGLPERSVSVLRAWMFQNFLHPYPKDSDKHLLALQSGLTRNQVSNWFINARVRLWKPMIDDMFAEMNERKVRTDGQEVSNNSQNRSIVSICHPIFDGI